MKWNFAFVTVLHLTGTVEPLFIYHVHDFVDVAHLSVLVLGFSPITAYQVMSLCWSRRSRFHFIKQSRIELKCHLYEATDIDVLNVFYHRKNTSDTKKYFQ